MTARNVFEIRQAHGVAIAFRTVDSDELLGDGPRPVLVMLPPNDAETYLTGEDVEGLHQFTFEVLAGRRSDPRLDPEAHIVCGAVANSPSDGPLDCCLYDGHRPVGHFDHITSRGIAFDTPGF
jgi:hypothetical protein